MKLPRYMCFFSLFSCFIIIILYNYNSLNKENLENLSNSFCEYYQSNPDKLEVEANNLTYNSCVNNKCTIWMNDKCMAGGKNGSTYKTTNGGTEEVKLNDYYYINKLYKK